MKYKHVTKLGNITMKKKVLKSVGMFVVFLFLTVLFQGYDFFFVLDEYRIRWLLMITVVAAVFIFLPKK